MRTEHYVYILFRKDGRPFYVGKGRGSRWLDHERRRSHATNRHLQAVLAKEDYDFPKVKVGEDLSEEEAHATEMAFIVAIGRRCDGTGDLTNLTLGGEGMSGAVWSEASRKKASISSKNRIMSDAQITKMRANLAAAWTPERREAWSAAAVNRWLDASYRAKVKREKRPLTDAHRAAISAAHSTPENIARMRKLHTGRKPSAEANMKISETKKGVKFTAEHKANISKAKKGKPTWIVKGSKITEKHKAAISAGKKGKTNGLKGRPLSDEHKASISAGRRATIERKKVLGIPDLSGRGRRAKYEREMAEKPK